MKQPYLLVCLLASLAVPAAAADAPTTKRGETIFKAYCAACHGAGGKGDGPASRTLPTNPANLTLSRAPEDYLKLLISEGGGAMGRSASMPAWGGTLSPPDIDSVILYINTLRQKK